jgi:uncharacterized protein YecE (DUF72 family)
MHPSWPAAEHIADLASAIPDSVHFGTSSWTYPGWSGLIYQREYPKTGASARMLGEYASWPLFRTVGIDSFFYRPASAKVLASYAEELPEGFRCVSKVWDRITAHTFANPREKDRWGEPNPDWLSTELFQNEVLGPMQQHFGDHLGPLILEFQTIAKKSAIDGAAFAGHLDRFFSALPRSAPFAVEIRNQEFLCPEYFAVLREHGVGHVFNAWTRMPPIGEQLVLHDAITAPFIVSRALLRPGRTYAKAVDAFAPYDHVQDENPVLRADLAALAKASVELRIPAYLLVNNRAEGCAPLTIVAVAERLARDIKAAARRAAG